MRIQKSVMTSLTFPYAIALFQGEERRVVVAPEKKGRCVSFGLGGENEQTIWDGETLGGTTGIAQIPGRSNEFLAIEGFYKGLQCEGAGIMHVAKRADGWQVRRVYELPFAHRIVAVKVEDETFVLVGSLCAGKANREDWSRAGRLYLGRWRDGEPLRLEPVGEPIHQHHGMFSGMRDGRRVILVSGREGVFELAVPERAGDAWEWRNLLAEPIGDVCVCDLDGDGVDELIGIKGFHGNEVAVYARRGDGWEEMYSVPICYGHFVWAGMIAGAPRIIAGYRRSNAALIMLTKSPGEWRFAVDVIDQHEAPVNMEVFQGNGTTLLFTTSEYTHQVVRYSLEEE